MKTDSSDSQRSRLPEKSALEYAPENELGVSYLFAGLARKQYGLRVVRIQGGYPDCLAYRGGKKVRIEFEYRSRNFLQHKHDPSKCDWIVCWIHDWPAVPKRVRVIELRRNFGLGFNVWFQPVADEYKDVLSRVRSGDCWSVAPQAITGDLLLLYRTAPDSCVRDLFYVAGPVEHVRAGWKPGKDWMAAISRVATLKAPLHLAEMKKHPVIRDAGFIRGKMRGRYRATAYWPELHDMIVSRNPGVHRALIDFGPERVE